MPRPRTKSQPIQFRLPLDIFDRIKERAAARNESPHDYIQRLVIAAASKDRGTELPDLPPGVSRTGDWTVTDDLDPSRGKR